MKINKSQFNILFIFILLSISILVFHAIYGTFYQQDEWQIVGHMISGGWLYPFNGFTVNEMLFGLKGRILANLLNYILFSAIPFSIVLLSTFNIIIHAFNAFLVYLLIKRQLKDQVVAVIASIFFITNSVANQAVIWSATSVSVLIATSLILLSLLFFLSYLEEGKIKSALFAYFMLYLSLFFKEIGIGFFLMYFIFYLIFYFKHKLNWNNLVFFTPLIVFGIFLIQRVSSILFSSNSIVDYANSSTPLKTFLVSNLLIYNFSSISQMIIPVQVSLLISNKFLFTMYPFLISNQQSNLIYQTIGVDIISILFSSIILITCFIICIKNKQYLNNLLFSLSIIFFSILPYIILFKNGPYLESRYYYLTLVGLSMLVGLFFLWLKNIQFRILFYIFMAIFAFYCLFNIYQTQIEIKKQNALAKNRLIILNDVKKVISKLPKKSIIYITSDKSYIIEDMPLPFQQGLGYTFLVYMNNPSNELNYLLDENYLWDMGTQGYTQKGNSGFGYFNSFEIMKEYIDKYSLESNIVYSFNWDSNNQILNNTTKKTRSLLDYRKNQEKSKN